MVFHLKEGMPMSDIKANRTRNLRYKRPALASLGYDALQTELWDIREACNDVHWFVEQGDAAASDIHQAVSVILINAVKFRVRIQLHSIRVPG